MIEAQEGVVTQYVHESAEHAFRAIGSAGLEADLLMVSLGFFSFGLKRASMRGRTHLYYTRKLALDILSKVQIL